MNNFQKTTKKHWLYFFCFIIIAIPSKNAFAQGWVDMGIRDENGNIIYWSSSDFAIYKSGAVGFVEYGESGSTFGWGDISGEKTGSNLSQYGGQYPPKRIDGNPKYDIVTAKLGSPYRLPTQREIQSLIDNCDISKTTITLGTARGTNGLPSWVQGQWMISDATLVRGRAGDGVINSSISVRIDGGIASYYNTSGNDYWEGPYKYSNGKITIGRLNLIVDNENQVLRDKNNNIYGKISSRTVSNKVTGILFTSRINGNTLLFAMPPSVSTYNSGNFYIVSNNSQEIDYWTGTLFERDNDCAVGMKMTSNSGFGVIAEPRSYHKRIRAVKVDVGSRVLLAEQKRIADSIANENKRIADSIAIGKRIADSIAREKEIRELELMKKRDAEILQSLYGKWKGDGEFASIELIIEHGRMSLYDYGEIVYEGSCRMSVDYGVVKITPNDFFSMIEKKLGRTYNTTYSLKYDNTLDCLVIEYRYLRQSDVNSGYGATHTIYLKNKKNKKKKK